MTTALEPETLLAAWLTEQAFRHTTLLQVTRSEARASRLAEAAQALAPGLLVVQLPGWDCLPYDRTSPSRLVMGRRMAGLAAMAARDGRPCLVVASLAAATQRLPTSAAEDAQTAPRLHVGDAFEAEAIEQQLGRLGYVLDDRVDEPGEAALHGAVLDVYPPIDGARPCRIEHHDGRITAIRAYDPLTQRSLAEIDAVTLPPASELVWPPEAEGVHQQGIEHALPELRPMATLFELLPDAAVVLDAEVPALLPQRAADIADACRARAALAPVEDGAPPPSPPGAMYLDADGWAAALRGRAVTTLEEADEEPAGTLPPLRDAAEPEDAFLDLVEQHLVAGRRVALAGSPGRRRAALLALLAERLQREPAPLEDWAALLASPAGTLAVLPAALPRGLATEEAVVIAVDDVRRPRARLAATAGGTLPPIVGTGLQPGDAVIHLDHGLGMLRGVAPVTLDDTTLDCLELEYAGGARQLVPLDEMDRVWRYGAEAAGVTLDRLGSDAWDKRRAAVEAEITETAGALLRLAEAGGQRTAPVLRARGGAYDRFAAGFPHALTQDQAEAIDDVLADLASGHPMHRLVCGDVGFGKTEVALRAAAVAVLAGRQVAILAPTTVLVRQHLTTFRRRFAGLRVHGAPVRIEQLSRLSSPAEARAVKAGLKDGSVQIVIGTQALAAKGVGFRELGLVVIDEEQRFGTRQKAALHKLADGVHLLAMTATPIPRSLQAALVGLQTLSVIATPPGRRQPIRTTHLPFDELVLRQALAREHRRGGQSFVVCARIEDLPAMRDRIRRLLPRLQIIEAHGELPAAEVDTALVRFAEGEGDVLLSTNIVETGLDVPRANTMLVWRADRFGLGQLHQLRGRVGRGRVRGSIVLLTDPAQPPTPATLKRLKALEAFDRIGAGFAISARDMDLRGAGDLLGESQAGHMKLIGLDLYQHLMQRALQVARGDTPAEEWMPQLSIGVAAGIPREHVEDETLRVELHARLAAILRGGDTERLEDFAEEITDRFGPPPPLVENLLALARLRLRCRRLGVARLEVGPNGAAARFRGRPPAIRPPMEQREGRVLLKQPSQGAEALLATAEAMLTALAHGRRAVRAREYA
ncbi:DEAD/DEAH box helicase [Roseomonas aerophila]|uniref:Transcription-repair-coupling factor n=1 Tax=Teichococcus aerophilus TaxID=1224513 RepID=A0ABR7RFQ1_9PROT|nr:DEAD/DEAH box helicase [Pseudoroseomonas aerophila]